MPKIMGDTTPKWTSETSEMNKSDSDDQKRSSVFQEKINRGDTAELAADRDGDD